MWFFCSNQIGLEQALQHAGGGERDGSGQVFFAVCEQNLVGASKVTDRGEKQVRKDQDHDADSDTYYNEHGQAFLGFPAFPFA